ncbi:MAG: metal ABC transporter permease [Phycisphaerales bacterium]
MKAPDPESTLSVLARLVSLTDPNTQTVLIGAAVLGLGAGVVGALAVLRRRALLGDCVAHASLPGICLAFMIVGERSLPVFMAGACVLGLAAVACIAVVRAYTRVKEDAAIGIALASFFGLGIVLLTRLQKVGSGNRAGLDRFLFGQAATMVRQDVMLIGGIVLVALAVVVVLVKEFGLLCFDREFAAASGRRVLALDFLLMALVCVCTVAGLPAVGVVLMAALLIIPAVAARLWVTRFGPMLVLSGTIGAASGAMGTLLSAGLPAPSASTGAAGAGWPTGPLITLVAALIFGVSLVGAPRRGLLAAGLRTWRLRRALAGRGLHGPLDSRFAPAGTGASGPEARP